MIIESTNSSSDANKEDINSVKMVMKYMLTKNSQNQILHDFDGQYSIDWCYFQMLYNISTSNLKLSGAENIIRLNKHIQ